MTLGLLVAGAVFGALAGVFTFGLAALLTGDHMRDEPMAFGLAAIFGAMLGTPLLPITAWLLLRRVPLGRAILGAVGGTVVGGVIGWYADFAGDEVSRSLIGGAVGFVMAAVALRAWGSSPAVNDSADVVSSDR